VAGLASAFALEREVAMKHYQLKKEEVIRILGDQSLKRWWVAEYAGVHKTTLRRWLQGKTRFVLNKNAEKLAQILETPLSQIAEPAKRSRKKVEKAIKKQ
jgi:predicted house-cleaning noncanonical NTP pyrophosphatase (MazG superfamily)